ENDRASGANSLDGARSVETEPGRAAPFGVPSPMERSSNVQTPSLSLAGPHNPCVPSANPDPTGAGALTSPCLFTGSGETFRPGGLAWRDGVLTHVGGADRVPAGTRAATGAVIPGFVDCHTHVPFAAWRSDEFEARLAGRTYRDVQGGGGGIYRS